MLGDPVVTNGVSVGDLNHSASLVKRQHYKSVGTAWDSWVRLFGPVIQANGRLIFEDDLRSGGLLGFTTQ